MIIQLLNGRILDTADFNLKRLFHRIPSTLVTHDTASVDGRSDIVTNTKFNNRTISVEFLYEAYDIYDYYLLRQELSVLFSRNEAFYIIFKREPYKRWKVRLSSNFDTEPNPHMGSFTVDFLTDNIWSESIYKTLEFVKEWDVNQHAWNNTIDWDGPAPQYTFTTNNFIVRNLGNGQVDPREHDLQITLNGEFPNGVTITNQTTSEVYRYNRALPSTSTLLISGVQTLINGISDFANTNKRLLTLTPLDNEIIVEGGTVNGISFDFRFLYQ